MTAMVAVNGIKCEELEESCNFRGVFNILHYFRGCLRQILCKWSNSVRVFREGGEGRVGGREGSVRKLSKNPGKRTANRPGRGL